MKNLFNALAVLLIIAAPSRAASLNVNQPADDAIVFSANVAISGTSTAASVKLQSAAMSASIPVINHEWSFSDVPLLPGLNALDLSDDAGGRLTLFITRGTGVTVRPPQKVRLVWEEGTDDELREIARGTLARQLDEPALAEFVRAVKALASGVFRRAYAGVADVRLTDDDGDDVHTIRFLGLDEDAFGLTVTDCGNADLHGRSRVFVGTYRRLLVGHLDQWAPMTENDSPEVRMQDIGEALGRTAAHELGHGLGLVIDDPASPCRWMNGCNISHSCSTFQNLHPGIRRFAEGAFIMDAGDETANHERLAEPGGEGRAERRAPSTFCDFDRSYLRLIHPTGATP